MGDPKKSRKKYNRPAHPWRKARITEEAELKKSFGFRSKKEVWKAAFVLKGFRAQARRLIGLRSEQATKEQTQLMKRLERMGMVESGSSLDAVLGLTIEDILSRRLQTMVFKKKLASTLKQARQLITHGHISVNGVVITGPSYLTSKDEESNIEFARRSNLSNSSHPLRKEQAEADKRLYKKETKTEETAEEKVEGVAAPVAVTEGASK